MFRGNACFIWLPPKGYVIQHVQHVGQAYVGCTLILLWNTEMIKVTVSKKHWLMYIGFRLVTLIIPLGEFQEVEAYGIFSFFLWAKAPTK